MSRYPSVIAIAVPAPAWRPGALALVFLWLCLAPALPLQAQEPESRLRVVVEGVEGDRLDNVRNALGGSTATATGFDSRRARNRLVRQAEDQAVIALRPYGHYHASATARLEQDEDQSWRLNVQVQPGPTISVRDADVRVEGPGAAHRSMRAWLEEWPLPAGAVLDQVAWEQSKQAALDRLTERGYFSARFTEQRIALDLDRQVADLALVLETGERAVIGDVRFQQDFLEDWVLRPVPRFRSGEPFQARLLEDLRTDLWKLGYFSAIDIEQERRLDSSPPTIDLVVKLEQIHRNTHQGTIGYGTDTEFRTQYRWLRHQLSPRGDNLTAGLAWQTRDEELLLYGEYRLPRRTDTQQYWLLSPSYRDRDQRFEFDVEGREESIPVADGRIEEFYLRAGRVALRNPERSSEQVIETLFVDYLSEHSSIDDIVLRGAASDDLESLAVVRANNQSIAVGAEWDWPNFRGLGFGLNGHRERAWLFTANEAWGSDLDFTQAYLSSRWNLRLGHDWRLLLRGEVGYSDAEVYEVEVQSGEDNFLVSVTELPFRYRFRAGGSHSVRGYDYEELSNNGIGSNHLLTGSVELEHRVHENWSVAAFIDAGNAFNDWGQAELKVGSGLGVRWYRFGFPVRLDVAQAHDLDGSPWRIHFTIGSPLF